MMFFTHTKKTTVSRSTSGLAALVLVISALPLMAQAAASSAEVTITGTVLANTCTTATALAINLGKINESELFPNTYVKRPLTNVVKLSGCGSDAKNVTVKVKSAQNSTPTGAATGITAVFFDNTDRELTAGVESSVIELKTSGTDKMIQLKPALKVTNRDTFKAGTVSTSITLDISYQ